MGVTTANEHGNNGKRRPLGTGRDELNLAEFPITVLTDKVPKGLKTLSFSDQIRDQGTGETVLRKVTITGSDIYGLPGPLDMDVLLCLIQLTKLTNNFTNPEVSFSRGELLRLLGLPDSGKHYRRIDESLRRWLGVTLYYENSWWDKEAQEWSSTEGWHILEHILIVDRAATAKRRAKGQLDLFQSSFTWNKVFFRSCQAENIKRLDLETYFSLERPIARRLYRFLDKRFYRRKDWTFDLKDFAFEHIGISRNYDVGEIKKKLQPALDELGAIGFLEPMSREERYTKVGPGVWKITLVQKAAEAIAREDKPLEAPADLPSIVARELTARGVTPTVATELSASNPPEHIKAQIEAFDWLVQKNDKRVSKSPAGYLVESIRVNYARPKGFESKAERERRAEAEREKRRQEAEMKQRERAERARHAAEEAKIKKHWNSLAPADQEQLDRDAIESSTDELRKSFETSKGGPVEAMMKKFIREAHIRKLLGIPEAPSPAQ